MAREISICFLAEIIRNESAQHSARLFFDSVQKYSSRKRKNNRYRGIAMPSVRMLLEYMEPRFAAKRHSRETASGMPSRASATTFGKPIFFHR